MKLKKFFAAVLAGAVALSSLSLSASAAASGSVDQAASSTVDHELFKFEAGVLTKWGDSITISKDKFSSVSEGSKIVVVSSPASGAASSQIALKDPVGSWSNLDGVDTYDVTTDNMSKEFVLSTAAVTSLKANGVALQGIGVSVKSVTLDGTTLYDSSTEKGVSGWKEISVTAGQLKEWGVTAENISECSVTATYGETPTAGVLGVYVNDAAGKRSNTSINYVTNITTASAEANFSNIKYAWNGSASVDATADTIANGVTVTSNDAVLSGLKFTCPASKTEDPGDKDPKPEEPGDKDEYVKIELETGISTGAELKPGDTGSGGPQIIVPTDKVDVKAIKKIVVAFDKTKITTDYFNGQIGCNPADGSEWYSQSGLEYPKNETWEWTLTKGIKDGLEVQFNWINKVQDGTNTPGTAAIKSVTLYGDGDKVLAVAEPKAEVAPNPDDGKDQTVDLVFDPTKDIEFTVVDASSWSAGAYTKAAQANVSIEIKGVTDVENTFKALKNTKVKFSGYDLSHYAFPDGIKGGNVSVSLFAKWVNKENPDKDSKWTASYNVNSTWALSSLKDVPDDYILDSIGCQLNINGTVAAVNSMNVGDKFTIKYDSTIVPEIDTSGWQIAVFGFGEGWKSKWSASKPNSGVLTFTDTIGNIMKNDGVEGEIGGLQIQVWNVPDKQDVSYSIVIKTGAGASYVNLTGTHTVSPTDTGFDYTLEQLCTGICWGDYIFKDDYVITVNVLPGKDKFKTESSDNTGASGVPIGTVTNGNTTSSDNKPEETVKVENGNNDTGATVNAPKGAFDKPEEVKFNAAPVAEETKDDKFTFDLNFTDKDGKEIQPKSAVTVSIPLPTALKDAKTVFVYHIEADGTYTEVSCKIENGMVVFSAKNFSKYVISGKKLDSKGEPAADQPATSDPATSDTTSGTSDTTPGTSGTTSGGTTTTEPNANTGAGGMAVVLGFAAIAGGALIVSKKRK